MRRNSLVRALLTSRGRENAPLLGWSTFSLHALWGLGLRAMTSTFCKALTELQCAGPHRVRILLLDSDNVGIRIVPIPTAMQSDFIPRGCLRLHDYLEEARLTLPQWFVRLLLSSLVITIGQITVLGHVCKKYLL